MADLLDRTLGDGVTIRVEDHSDGWRVLADRVQLENAILNLAVNARDAMDGRGTLTVALGQATLAAGQTIGCAPGEYVTVGVTDTGTGMTPEVAERVFEPFFTTKEVGRGTGLGLSQIFALVDQLGGHVGLDTAPGSGTTVTLHLPRAEGQARAAEVTAAAVPVDTAPVPLRVLVVEDDPRVLATTVAALRELGHDPVPCDDPLAAPAILEREAAFDLLVSDVLMPRRTGPEMFAALPARFQHLPILYVTGFAGETGAEALEGHAVLRKPFTLAALEAAVGRAVEAGRGPERIAAE
jgi:CheY-like chemotaxis protein